MACPSMTIRCQYLLVRFGACVLGPQGEVWLLPCGRAAMSHDPSSLPVDEAILNLLASFVVFEAALPGIGFHCPRRVVVVMLLSSLTSILKDVEESLGRAEAGYRR